MTAQKKKKQRTIPTITNSRKTLPAYKKELSLQLWFLLRSFKLNSKEFQHSTDNANLIAQQATIQPNFPQPMPTA